MLLCWIDCHLELFTGNYPTGVEGQDLLWLLHYQDSNKKLEFQLTLGTSPLGKWEWKATCPEGESTSPRWHFFGALIITLSSILWCINLHVSSNTSSMVTLTISFGLIFDISSICDSFFEYMIGLDFLLTLRPICVRAVDGKRGSQCNTCRWKEFFIHCSNIVVLGILAG